MCPAKLIAFSHCVGAGWDQECFLALQRLRLPDVGPSACSAELLTGHPGCTSSFSMNGLTSPANALA